MITIDVDARVEIDVDFYFTALAFLALGDDGEIDDAERQFIRTQAGLYEVDADAYLTRRPQWGEVEVLRAKPSRQTALSVIRDGIALGYINGAMTAGQRGIVYEVADRLGLAAADVDAVEGWLKDYWALLERGQRLLHGD